MLAKNITPCNCLIYMKSYAVNIGPLPTGLLVWVGGGVKIISTLTDRTDSPPFTAWAVNVWPKPGSGAVALAKYLS